MGRQGVHVECYWENLFENGHVGVREIVRRTKLRCNLGEISYEDGQWIDLGQDLVLYLRILMLLTLDTSMLTILSATRESKLVEKTYYNYNLTKQIVSGPIYRTNLIFYYTTLVQVTIVIFKEC
jgi:hypothetical protein